MTAAEPIEHPGARLSIWRDAASLEGLKTAALGAFSCETAEAGAALLTQTAERLAAEGFKAVVGPMDGDTWAYHRLVVESDGRAPFPLEPSNPPHYPAAFEQAGWPVISRYISSEGRVEVRAQTRTAPGLNHHRLDVHNGLLLSALWDAAFDRGLVSFDETGQVLHSPRLSDEAKERLQPARSLTGRLAEGHRRNLARHRRTFGFEY